MEAVNTKNLLELDGRGIDLAVTLGCGQTFSWWQQDEGLFAGVAGPHAVLARQAGPVLQLQKPDATPFDAAEADFWHHYFALGEDYETICGLLRQSKPLAACVATAPGIRVLRQPFFDTLLCFILSQNSNIPRITQNATGLRTHFGRQLYPGFFAFPAAERLAALDVAELEPLRAGYRARYLIEAGRAVASGRVTEEALHALDDEQARQALCGITGVGRKVADCVLLFGLGRRGVAPMDTWMNKAMPALFEDGAWPACAAGLEGIAQQYVFWWARNDGLKPK